METLVTFVPRAITGETSIKIKGLVAYLVGEVDYVFEAENVSHFIHYWLYFEFSEVFIAYTCNALLDYWLFLTVSPMISVSLVILFHKSKILDLMCIHTATEI